MTIYEMAKKANVSIATISRAMSPATRGKVAPETLEKIDGLVKKHGYTPNLAARNMGRTAFKTIGVVLPHLRGIFFSGYYRKVLAGVADALLDSEYHFKLILLKPAAEKWDKYDFKVGESVDGLIITHWPNFFSNARVVEKLKVPCVVMNDPEPHVNVHFATGDNLKGGELAAEYLYSKGHRKIAVMAGPAWSSDSALRVKGFKGFLKKAGPGVRIVELKADFHEEEAAQAAETFLKGKERATAIFCCNDLMACGVLKKFRESGMKCPEDISVMGYDDDERASSSDPPLTTVQVPLYEMTKEATRRLLDHLTTGGKNEPFGGQTLFPVRLVERESVRQVG